VPVAPRVAVVGHVEWVTHARGSMPHVGQIAHLVDGFDEPAGGGAVTAAQVARLGADCHFYTALSGDGNGEASRQVLAAGGVTVIAARREQPQTRALTVVGPSGERTILVTGERLSPLIDDALPWAELSHCDGAFFTGDDPRTLIAARAARHLVVTARRLASLISSGVQADVVVASVSDPDEAFDPASLPVAPHAFVFTDGERGGRIVVGGSERPFSAQPPPGPVVDTYGAGDSFAAGLTVGLAEGLSLDEAVALGARCGATALTVRGGGASDT
jgi:ribokinase